MSLKENIENNPVIILGTVLFFGFGLGAGAVEYLNQRDKASVKLAEETLNERVTTLARELNFEKSRADQLEQHRVELQTESAAQVTALEKERAATRRLLGELQMLQLEVARQISELSKNSKNAIPSDERVRGIIKHEIINLIEREAEREGVPPFLGEEATRVDTSEILNGKPLGGENALVPQAREDVLDRLDAADQGSVANIIRDPFKCLTFQRKC